MPDKAVLSVRSVGKKLPLPDDLFNTSTFEWAMSSGQEEFPARNGYPKIGFPDQKVHLQQMPLNLAYLPKMAPFAIAAYQQPPEAYLDAETLRLSYQAAYRLLFARQVVDILHKNLDPATSKLGKVSYSAQAVVVVPGFAYAAEGLLVIVAVVTLCLLIINVRRNIGLHEDPGTIEALMDLAHNNVEIVRVFSRLAGCTTEQLHEELKDTQF